jgi:alpha-beta hydrolase superfamily lysophospholipase
VGQRIAKCHRFFIPARTMPSARAPAPVRSFAAAEESAGSRKLYEAANVEEPIRVSNGADDQAVAPQAVLACCVVRGSRNPPKGLVCITGCRPESAGRASIGR